MIKVTSFLVVVMAFLVFLVQLHENTLEIQHFPLLLGGCCSVVARSTVVHRSSGLIVVVPVCDFPIQIFTLIWLSTVWISSAFCATVCFALDFIFSVGNVGRTSASSRLEQLRFEPLRLLFGYVCFCFVRSALASFTLP